MTGLLSRHLPPDTLRRVGGWLALAIVIVASVQLAVLLSKRFGASPVAFAVVPAGLVGLYLLAMRREWLLIAILATRAALDPLLLAAQSSGGGGMGPGALINALLVVLAFLYFVQQPRRFARPQVLAWVPFLAIALMAMRAAPDAAKAARLMMTLVTFAAAMALPVALVRSRDDARRWWWVLIAASLVPTVTGIGDALTGGVKYIEPDEFELQDALSAIEQAGFRIQGSFGHPNIYAFFLLTVIASLLYALRTGLFGERRRWRLAAGAYLMLQLGLLVCTQTRSAWAVCGFMFLAYGLFVDRRALLGLVVVPLAALMVPAVQDRIVDVLSSSGQATDGELNSYGWRLAMWRSAMPWIRDEWLLGWGLDSYNTYSTTFFPLEYLRGFDAHNVYVQLAFEAGVPGAVAFAAIFVTLLAIAVSALRRHTLEAVLLGSLSVGYLMACYSDNMHRYLTSNWYAFFAMGLLAVLASRPATPAPAPAPASAPAPAPASAMPATRGRR